MDKKSSAKKIFGIIGTVFFFLSYIPYVWIIINSIEGVQTGLIGGPYVHGFDAMINILLWLCIIPIVPACFIYQLIFGIAYIRKRRKLSIVTLILVVLIVAGILAAGLPEVIKNDLQIKTDSPVISEYLEGKYGQELASNITLKVYDYESHGYKVTAPVLPEGLCFYTYVGNGYYDDLINTFTRENADYQERFDDYINSKYNMPENIRFQTHIESIDFGDYENGDDTSVLFERTNYSITAIAYETEEISDDIAIGIFKDAWNNYFSQSDIPSDTDHLTVYITRDGKNMLNAAIMPDKDHPAAYITAYSDYSVSSDLNGQRISLNQ